MSYQPSTEAKSTPLPASTPSETPGASSSAATPSRSKSRLSIAGLKRTASNVLQSKEAASGKRMITAAGKTVIGAHPIFLMGEAITGRKVGSQFRKGKSELGAAAEELLGILGDSAKDVLVIVDEKLQAQKEETTKTADVLRSAGTDAIVVVTTSLIESKTQFEKNAPGLKYAVLKNSKDVVVIVDKAIKHPIVVTGVTKYAKANGVPRPEAVMTIAALCVGKLVKVLEKAEGEALAELERLNLESQQAEARAQQLVGEHGGESSSGSAGDVVVIDASDFEKTTSKEDTKAAKEVGRTAAHAPGAEANTATTTKESADRKGKGKENKEDGGCVIM
ncbi:hypothetical protein FRC18_006536 [Serendipita sp. 400]|nr:hypothetical protein FRC18_006536 [Serendipita sp. 400]